MFHGDPSLKAEDGLTAASVPVTHLVSGLLFKGHWVFMDNFYTGYPLAWWLLTKGYV